MFFSIINLILIPLYKDYITNQRKNEEEDKKS